MTALLDWIAQLEALSLGRERSEGQTDYLAVNLPSMIAALRELSGTVQIAENQSIGPFASPQTLWTYTGGIYIHGITGVVRSQIQNQVTNAHLAVQNDALAHTDLCGNANIGNAAIGTVFHLRSGAANPLDIHPTGTDGNTNALSEPIATVCTIGGFIYFDVSAASTGTIDWFLLWSPLTPDATVTPV
jgi:hypothetical protein